MSIKPIISNPKSGMVPEEEGPPIEAKLKKINEDLQLNSDQLADLEDDFKLLPATDQAKVKSLKERLDAQIALINSILDGDLPYGAAGLNGDMSSLHDLSDLAGGYHGLGADLRYVDHDSDEFYEMADIIAEMDDTGPLVDIIALPEGSDDPTALLPGSAIANVITDAENVESVTYKNFRKHIVCTITRFGGESETVIFKNVADRDNFKLYTSAEKCSRDIVIDASQLKLFGVNAENIMTGGMADDLILGSAGRDIAVGGEGDDRIITGDGSDDIYGGGAARNSLDDYLHSTNAPTDGDNFIDPGGGFDKVWGGGGWDTVVNDINQPGGEDKVSEAEDIIDVKEMINKDAMYEMKNGMILKGWGAKVESTGEIVLTQVNDFTGDYMVGFTAPDGFTKSYADTDGADTVITFAKIGEDSDGYAVPEYIKVRVKDPQNTTFEISACESSYGDSIFDYSRIDAGDNSFVLIGSAGDDILIGPPTALDRLGISEKDLEGNLTDADMNKILDSKKAPGEDGKPTGESKWGGDWGSTTVNNGVIELVPKTNLDSINFEAPEGFGQVDGAFYRVEGDNLLIYVVQRPLSEDGQFKILQIRIIGGVVNNKVPPVTVAAEPATAIGSTVYYSGDGHDIIVGSKGSTSDWNDDSQNDTIIEIEPEDLADEEIYDFGTDNNENGVPDEYEDLPDKSEAAKDEAAKDEAAKDEVAKEEAAKEEAL